MTCDGRETPISSRAFGDPLVDVGGRFMVAPEMAAQAHRIGLGPGELYLRGRCSAVGDVSADAAIAVMGIFSPCAIRSVWSSTSDRSVDEIRGAYRSALTTWGEHHLRDSIDTSRLSDLAGRVVDAADGTGLPLFAGWRSATRPTGGPALAAHLLMLLRELRGGLHFAALRTHGLGVAIAALTDPRQQVQRLRRTGWSDSEIETLEARQAAIPDAAERWAAADQATGTALGTCLQILDSDEREDLAGLIDAAERASRPGRVGGTAAQTP